MGYAAPVADMRFVLEDLCGLEALSALPGLEDSDYGIEFSDANYALVKAAIDQRFQTFQRVKTD